ncbi:MAG: MutS-related protein [Fervidobacterium sp.]
MTNLTVIPKREDFEKITGFEYIKSLLEPKTPFGSKYFRHIQPLSFEHIAQHLEDTYLLINLLNNKVIKEVLHDLECIVDISTTAERVKRGEIIDEIELFELKNYALVVESIREKISSNLPDYFLPPQLTEVIELLDPEGLKMPTFYIYDAYDDKLKQIRKRKRELLKDGKEHENELLELSQQEHEIEGEILEKLSQVLHSYSHKIIESIERIKYLDVILAKAKLAKELGLTKPEIVQDDVDITIHGIFNPKLKVELENRGKKYQPVDIQITRGVTLIIGANMSGKSVVLRTVALIQYMAQHGFFVPAAFCKTRYLEHISIIVEDNQRPLSGLSSFGAEILMINETIKQIEKGISLVLIDEPARTTNPLEGTAIVNALVNLLEEIKPYALIVTHFDNVRAKRRLKVNGLREELIKSLQRSEDIIINIQDYIDYRLVETDDTSIPKEATRVMELLGVDKRILELVNKERKGEANEYGK